MDGAQTVDSGQQTPPLPPNTNHHRHPTMTQPCHKDTHPNQQCCDSKNNEGRDKAKMGSRTTQDARPNANTGTPHHAHHRPSTRGAKRTTRGTPTPNKGGHQHWTGRSAILPPFHHHATPPPTTAPPTTMNGGGHQRIPHHAKTSDRHSPTHHMTWQRTAHDATAVLTQYALGVDGIGHTTGQGRPVASHTTAIPHTTGETDTIHSPHLTLFTFTHQ